MVGCGLLSAGLNHGCHMHHALWYPPRRLGSPSPLPITRPVSGNESLSRWRVVSHPDIVAFRAGARSDPEPRALRISGYEARFQQLAWDAGESQREIESMRDWISQLPEGVGPGCHC